MHVRTYVCLAFLARAIGVACATESAALTVNDPGDGGDGTCTTVCTLRDAIANVADGGSITFDPAILPATISLQKYLAIQKSMRIDGPGAGMLTLSRGGAGRVLTVGAHLAILTVAIANLSLEDGTLAGQNGADAAAASGMPGGQGGGVAGGCVYIQGATLTLQQVRMRNCIAQGGDGGLGGSGTTGSGLGTGGKGGAGGPGGYAFGGAIYVADASDLILVDTVIIDSHANAGKGGKGGDGGNGLLRGIGGNGGLGGDAAGAAIFFGGDSLSITNSTIARDTAHAGDGGNGGVGDPALATAHGGDGGTGGAAAGGLVRYMPVLGAPSANFDFTTFAEGEVSGGGPGSGGTAATPGAAGQPGSADGAALLPEKTVTIRSTAIVGSSSHALCNPKVVADAGSTNLDQDSSCGANLHAPLDAVFRPLAQNAALPTYKPLYASAVIDSAASCNDSNLIPVAMDGVSTPRPQGGACDIGAIEADYIFANGFN
ncbi:MAG TPA: choice-of-anchor Q domain-containing protein [Rudaea sp.]|nr:choice-of-anchor Q domain-containing protein [Rudaea sp.]